VSDDEFDPTGSKAFFFALDLISEEAQSRWVYVPSEPTEEMMRAGAAMGGVSPQVAKQIYKAMLWWL
jgi:hypothetical protein